MAGEQSHGKRFESSLIERSGFFPLMKTVVLSSTSLYDVPSEYTEDMIPVSIKTALYPEKGLPTIYLSDAVRFYQASQEPLRLICGFYRLEKGRSVFRQIFVCVVLPVCFEELWGELTEDDLVGFSDFIKTEKRLIGDNEDLIRRLQKDVQAYKNQFKERCGGIVLNPKVSRGVGRLQCSIDIGVLISILKKNNCVFEFYEHGYGDFPLPVSFESGSRVGRCRSF